MQWRLNGGMPRDSTYDALAGRLRTARKARHMTQQQLAKAAGLQQSDVSKIERGEIQKTTAIARLALALRVRPEWLELRAGDDPNWEESLYDPTAGSGTMVLQTTEVLRSYAAAASALSPLELDLLHAFRAIPDEEQQELVHDVMARAERFQALVQRELAKRGITVSAYASANRAAEVLPPAPSPPSVTEDRRHPQKTATQTNPDANKLGGNTIGGPESVVRGTWNRRKTDSGSQPQVFQGVERRQKK
jgi:transcriptional regulator with XRE-family HTH domain